jgi:hypothetical protein
MLFDDTKDDIGYAFVRGNDGPLKSSLIAQCTPACFVDMRDSSDPLVLGRQPVWSEAGIQQMSPAKNFDGIVWVANVHPPEMPLARTLMLSGLHYHQQLRWIGFGILAALAVLVVWRIRRWRSRAP